LIKGFQRHSADVNADDTRLKNELERVTKSYSKELDSLRKDLDAVKSESKQVATTYVYDSPPTANDGKEFDTRIVKRGDYFYEYKKIRGKWYNRQYVS
jgi:hypothetical protein